MLARGATPRNPQNALRAPRRYPTNPAITSAYGVGRLATGHHTGHDIAILVIGLGAGAFVTVAAVRRHRRRTVRPVRAPARRPSDDPS